MEPEEDEPEETERPVLWITGWVGIGVGAAVAAAGAITGGVALDKSNELNDNCPDKNQICPEEHQDLKDSADSLAIATNVLLPVGGALAVAGVVLVILGRDRGEDSSGVASIGFAPFASAEQAGLTVRGRF